MSHVARKFERLLEAYRREDGGTRSGVEFERATGGVVTRSYVTNLCKGRIENPGMDKLAAMARAMGFPSSLSSEEGLSGAGGRGAAGTPEGLAGRVGRRFGAIEDPKTGKTYTSAGIARMSLGDLTEEDVEGLRSSSVADPIAGQVVALAGVFGVEPSYLLDRSEVPLDGELVEALRDEAIREAAIEISRLPERERRLVLGIVRHFGDPGEPPRA